jgi:hypothetical protein
MVEDLRAKLEQLARRWFPPAVSREIDEELARLSRPLVTEASVVTEASASDRFDALERDIDEATEQGRALFAELGAALDDVDARIGGLERTADALKSSGLDLSVVDFECVTYSRKVWLAGRGDGFLTLAGQKVVFQPLQKTGVLFRKADQVGVAEVMDVSPGLTISELRRPKLGDHGITLRQLPPGSTTIYLSLSPDALDDLISARS